MSRPHRLASSVSSVAITIAVFMSIADQGCWAAPPADSVSAGSAPADQAIKAGEFAVAKSLPPATLPGARDRLLAQVATAQSLSGESSAAAATVRQIETPADRQHVLDNSLGAVRDANAQGGGAFADFDSLMNLIETTVVPDTWEALGGNSTMAPYPQGVYVDAAGTVEMAPLPSEDQSLAKGAIANLDALLAADLNSQARDWRAPSPMRCVSLRRLRDEITTRRMSGVPLGDSLLHLAGLSRVQYLILTDDDIVLAAPTSGIDMDRGWYVDRQSGRATLRSDFLARCLAATQAGTPFGCTIDPTPTGMQAAMQVADQIRSGQIPIGKSAEQLRQALGMQRVEVFGAAGDTSVALLMVEADRHMKQLALGQQPMPEGVANYLDVVDDFIDQGPPNGLLLRLWFTAHRQSVRCDGERRVFEIAGNAVRLSGENQRALADGGRGDVTGDPRSAQFVAGFNRNWARIRDQYPIYGALESLYRLAAVSHLIDRFGAETAHRDLALALASEDDARDWNLPAPKQVESIATMHTVRKGSQRHHVLLASGGVSVATDATVKSTITTYPTLQAQTSLAKRQPVAVNHWWWDGR
ncbi:DUF1598 domain-containing protein [Rhodopirellula sp. JC639]|uniref:DUF1598 domain-containing protein n=1 Tax=Stieleria mannarensis TaxID=2755585 RepID=UPI00160092CC|nr:DUF1598 domain-containing protein [Rhodopirellula sp. JC639]